MSVPLTRRATHARRPAPRQDWATRAACARHPDPDLWFALPGDQASQEQAAAICATCPVRTACLDYAMSLPSMRGTWGGTTEAERTRLRRNARRHSPKERDPR